MADLIKIKGGSGDVPALQDRELAIKKKEKELYCGINGETVRLCGAEDAEKVEELDKTIINLQGQIETMSKAIEDITARLDALTPSE